MPKEEVPNSMMWTERYTVYYSKETHYAVRWLVPDHSEEEAQFKTFDDKGDAERFYDKMTKEYPDYRIELFFSQAKWLGYYSNHHEFGVSNLESITSTCVCHGAGTICTCPCHADVPHAPLPPAGLPGQNM
jgi:hypothetical protein